MGWGRSIEDRHGVDAPDYEPPAEAVIEIPEEATGFGALEVVGSILMPIAGIGFAILRFSDEEIGRGLACLLLAGLGVSIWAVALVAVLR